MTGSVRVGVLLASATALVSGVAVWINSFGLAAVPDAILYTTLKNGVAAAVLLGILAIRLRATRAPAAPALDYRTSAALVLLGLLGGGVAFILFFSGLAAATASGAAFIHKTLFVWVAMLAVPLLGERLGPLQVGALGVLLAGQILLAPPRAFGWGAGETMILAATAIWAVEVIVARRLLARVPSLTLGVARLGIGLVVLVGVVAVTGRAGGLASVSAVGWSWVLVTGALLAGYVGLWFAALQRAPATVVTSVLVGGAVVTSALSTVAAGRVPDLALAGAWVLVLAAAGMITFVTARATAVATMQRDG